MALTQEGTRASQGYDQRFDDPALRCSPANILFGWTHDQHVNEIVQTPDRLVLRYGYMDFSRTIDLKATQHPRTVAPGLGGHAIGRWDGDVLEVDTVGFAPGVLIPIAGILHSERLHVVERFTLDPAAGTLTRSYRAEDPRYLAEPYTGTDVMRRSSEAPAAYGCVELSGKNNQRPR